MTSHKKGEPDIARPQPPGPDDAGGALTAADLRRIGAEITAEAPAPDAGTGPELVLMPVDPWHVHAYWRLGADDLQRARRRLPWPDGHAPLVLRFHDVTPGATLHAPFDIEVTGLTNHRYVDLWQDGRCYQAEIGLRGPDGLIVIASANRIDVPRAGPARPAAPRRATEQPPAPPRPERPPQPDPAPPPRPPETPPLPGPPERPGPLPGPERPVPTGAAGVPLVADAVLADYAARADRLEAEIYGPRPAEGRPAEGRGAMGRDAEGGGAEAAEPAVPPAARAVAVGIPGGPPLPPGPVPEAPPAPTGEAPPPAPGHDGGNDHGGDFPAAPPPRPLESITTASSFVHGQENVALEVNAELHIFGRARPGSHLTLYGQPVAVAEDGTFSVRRPLPHGALVLPLLLSQGSEGT